MSARIFTHTEAGVTTWGITFDSEVEFQTFLGARGVVLVTADSSPPPPEPRAKGRPSCDSVIEAAVQVLGVELDVCETARDAARRVQQHIAQASSGTAPSLRTLERWFSDKASAKTRPARKWTAGG